MARRNGGSDYHTWPRTARERYHYIGLEFAQIYRRFGSRVTVDDQLLTSAPGIWAIGEVNGRGAFAHTSDNDFEIVAANLLNDDPRRVSDRILCYGLFIDPPLGRIGMTEAEARATGRPVLVGKRMMARVGRAREFSETQGFMKVLVAADSGSILGAAIRAHPNSARRSSPAGLGYCLVRPPEPQTPG